MEWFTAAKLSMLWRDGSLSDSICFLCCAAVTPTVKVAQGLCMTCLHVTVGCVDRCLPLRWQFTVPTDWQAVGVLLISGCMLEECMYHLGNWSNAFQCVLWNVDIPLLGGRSCSSELIKESVFICYAVYPQYFDSVCNDTLVRYCTRHSVCRKLQ